MYNRYIRNDNGVYQRIPEEDASPPPRQEESPPPPPPPNWESAPPPNGGRKGFLSDILGRLHLDGIDTGDLLLLLILFLLYQDGADEELLIALGLLLIL